MELPIDIIIRVDAKKENNSGEYTFQCKALGELVRCKDCKHHEVCKNGVNGWCNEHERPTDVTYFCADGERKDGEHDV